MPLSQICTDATTPSGDHLVDRPVVQIADQQYRRVLSRSSATYTNAVGPITVERTLYRAGRARAVAPLELRAGIIGGHWTPLAARQASVLVAHLTPRESAAVLDELGAMQPSVSSLDRLPKHLSERWEEHREAFEERCAPAARCRLRRRRWRCRWTG